MAEQKTINGLNGYTFIVTSRVAEEEGSLPARIILGEGWRGDYVTAILPDGDSSWQYGHYFDNSHDAAVDYCERCVRGF